MKINFKKVSAIAASALMVGMTMGVAAAANYPNPFVVSGSTNVAIVYGTGAGVSSLDLVQAGDIESNLQSYTGASSTVTSSNSVTGEAADLSAGSGIYVNDSIVTSGKTILTKYDMPTILADTSFSGNVAATGTETLQIGTGVVTFAQEPTTTSDGTFALVGSTLTATQMYNATVTFNKAVNFTDAASKGQPISLFGQQFTIGSSTDANDLVLLQSAQTISLERDVSSSGATNTAATTSVVVGGQTYTIQLISATSTSAIVKVTDSSGNSATSQSISAGSSKTVDGITVAVISTSQGGNVEDASIVVGAQQITLVSNGAVTIGTQGTAIQGTYTDFNGGSAGNLTQLTVRVAAPALNNASVIPGTPFIDPVFQTFEITSPGFNNGLNSTAREAIQVGPSGNTALGLTMTDYRGYALAGSVIVENLSNGAQLMYDASGDNISVAENRALHLNDEVWLGYENYGNVVKITNVANSSNTCTLTLQDVFSNAQYTANIPSGSCAGYINVGSKQYYVNILGNPALTSTYNITINSPSDISNKYISLFPSVQTSKGAKVQLYAPQIVNLSNPTGMPGAAPVNASGITIPNGQGGYTTIAVANNGNATARSYWNISSSALNISIGASANVSVAVGPFVYDISGYGANTADSVVVTLVKPGTVYGSGNLSSPAILVTEEKDDKGVYNGWEVPVTAGTYATLGTPVDTWSNGSSASGSAAVTRYSNNKLTDKADRYGVLETTDTTNSNQETVTFNYPDNQLADYLFMAANTAVITPGSSSIGGVTQIGDILVTDSQVSSVSSKNLIIVGGSCINSVAANLLGSTCGSDFTAKTGVGSGQFLIQSFASPYSTGKIALVVAGYEAADTVNAGTYLRTQTVNTAVKNKYVGTSATQATLSTVSS